VQISSAIINNIQTKFDSTAQYSKFDGVSGQDGYYIGFRYGNDGKACVIFIAGGSFYVICRNFRNISSGIWKAFMFAG
jgi:hypothetical protein